MAETLDSKISLALGNVPDISDDMTPDEVYEALLKVHAAIEILVDFYDTAGGLYVTLAGTQDISGNKTFQASTIFESLITIVNANIVLGTGAGTRLGTASAQRLAFWGASPTIQPAEALQAAITNSSGGGQDGTLVSTTGAASLAAAADGAKTNDNFTDIYALLNAMRTALINSGIMKGSA